MLSFYTWIKTGCGYCIHKCQQSTTSLGRNQTTDEGAIIYILALNEAKIDQNYSSDLLKIDGYKFIKHDRNRNGGGVGICCQNTMHCTQQNDIPASDLELLCIEITPPKAKPYIIISGYRPPPDTVETFNKLEHIFQLLELEGKEIVLLGDTNCDFNICNGTCKSMIASLPNNIKHLMDLYKSFGLRELIGKPTRETIDTSTLIDHIAVNNDRNIIESGVLNLGFSDHYLVYAITKFRGNIFNDHKYIKTRQMKNFNQDILLRDLANINWHQVLYSSQNINEVVIKWTKLIALIIEKHAPLRERRVSDKFTPWLTSDIKCMFRTRDKLKAAAIKAKSTILMEAYKRIRNKANALNTRLKKKYFSAKIQSCDRNLKEAWATINKLINKRSKTTSISSILEDDVLITGPDGIANSMNKYYCSIGGQLSDKIPNKPNNFVKENLPNVGTAFRFLPLTPQQLIKPCLNLRPRKALGLIVYSFFLNKGMPILACSLESTIYFVHKHRTIS